MNSTFIFCQEKGQRVSIAVCKANVSRGKCTQDLFKCHKTREKAIPTDKTFEVNHHDHLKIVTQGQEEEEGFIQFNLFDLPERKAS